jgi:glycosyltransferase involved in cell wall biosynthesis
LTEVREHLAKYNLNNKVTFAGWIPHEKLQDSLNELKLLVVPSYTEGLPNIMLEAMACGTPVLATPVGGVPDVIEEGETGFLLEDNSPQAIAHGVSKVLHHAHLAQVALNARRLIEEKFEFDASVERFRKILND